MSDQSVATLSGADLIAAGRTLPVPFYLEIDPSSTSSGFTTRAVECVEVLRVLPGRRVVARARVADAECVAKIFYGSGARRYFERERRGLQRLTECGVPTPALHAQVRLADDAGFALLHEWLDGAVPVAEDDHEAFVHVVAALAHLHNASATQTDPHLNNYLRDPTGRVFAIDGDGVRRWPVLSRWRALANLGMLLAQLPPTADRQLFAACAEYDRVRWQTSVSDAFLAEVQHHLHRQRRARTRRYLAKTMRECTEFHCAREPDRFVVCARNAWNAAMVAFVEDPQAPFTRAVDAAVLKAGNSATVIRARIGAQSYVIKRYNVKSLSHGLRRTLRPTPRYRRAWRFGHGLAFLRLPTARPVALVERRTGLLATVAYLVVEDLGADTVDLTTWVARHGAQAALVDKVALLFRGLADAELVHGDTKASNFLVCDEEVYLIDLDAMASGRHGLAADVARFLANWDHDPATRTRFAAALRAVGMPL